MNTNERATAADGLRLEKYSDKAHVIRGYNQEQRAELLRMGGKEWRTLRGGKAVIFSTRRHLDTLRQWISRETATASAPAPTCTPLRPSGFVIRF
jgi:hypothetical protein